MSNLFDIKMVFTQIPDLLTYLPVTLELAVVSMIVSLILGLILALIKMKKIPVLKQLANLYISVIRGTPVLVQLYVTYFGIPMILKAINLMERIIMPTAWHRSSMHLSHWQLMNRHTTQK